MRFDKEIYQRYRKLQRLLTVQQSGQRVLRPDYPEFAMILAEIESAIVQLSAPLRVAVAGYMKAGKSTLLNAIMQKKVLCTGEFITTYTPTWFRYAPHESLELVFDNGEHLAGLTLDDLETWTSIQRREENPKIDQVSYVILYYPNDLLKELELIDTPGLFSPEEKDSERTIKLLGLGGLSEANRLGQMQVSMADAIVYAFSANFKKKDMEAVKAFTSTPINAIAVFTKLEQSYWDLWTPDISPMEKMAPVIQRNAESLKNELYCMLPVISIVVEGFVSLTKEDWNALCALAQVPVDDLSKRLFSPQMFEKAELPGTTPQQRLRLYQLLDKYGIYCVVRQIQNGVKREEILANLYTLSGVEAVVRELKSHFGLRSFIIKTETAFSRIENKLQMLKYAPDCTPQTKRMCVQIQQELDEAHNLHEFTELALLRNFYEGTLQFPTEEDNLSFLRLMGEQGNGAAKKLGLPSGAGVEVLLKAAVETHRHWSTLANDPTLQRNVSSAAQTVLSSINDLRYHIEMLSQF